jgi:hypothetical protein
MGEGTWKDNIKINPKGTEWEGMECLNLRTGKSGRLLKTW